MKRKQSIWRVNDRTRFIKSFVTQFIASFMATHFSKSQKTEPVLSRHVPIERAYELARFAWNELAQRDGLLTHNVVPQVEWEPLEHGGVMLTQPMTDQSGGLDVITLPSASAVRALIAELNKAIGDAPDEAT